MELEDKMLLIRDLSARLPYAVHVQHTSGFSGTLHDLHTHHKYDENDDVYDIICFTNFFGDDDYIDIEYFKPYLFPLSSMTKEQEEEFNGLFYRYHESAFIFNERFSYDRCSIKDIGFYPCYLQDWLDKNHFDYRGLIPKGLAIDATGKNIY